MTYRCKLLVKAGYYSKIQHNSVQVFMFPFPLKSYTLSSFSSIIFSSNSPMNVCVPCYNRTTFILLLFTLSLQAVRTSESIPKGIWSFQTKQTNANQLFRHVDELSQHASLLHLLHIHFESLKLGTQTVTQNSRKDSDTTWKNKNILKTI
jgi:hypothetical protein